MAPKTEVLDPCVSHLLAMHFLHFILSYMEHVASYENWFLPLAGQKKGWEG
jgi:hypothetical protein